MFRLKLKTPTFPGQTPIFLGMDSITPVLKILVRFLRLKGPEPNPNLPLWGKFNSANKPNMTASKVCTTIPPNVAHIFNYFVLNDYFIHNSTGRVTGLCSQNAEKTLAFYSGQVRHFYLLVLRQVQIYI